MSALRCAQIYAATLAVMLVLDGLWLGVVAKSWYQQGIGHLMATQPRLGIGALFYLTMPIGLMVFAVLANGPAQSALHAVLMGALFGFFAYATYDITNLATLRDWPVSLAIVDVLWGSLVCGLAAGAGKLVQLHVGQV